MSSDPQVPGISQTEEVVEHPVEAPTTWLSRHSRSLWGVGAVSAAIIIGVSIRALFRSKN